MQIRAKEVEEHMVIKVGKYSELVSSVSPSQGDIKVVIRTNDDTASHIYDADDLVEVI